MARANLFVAGASLGMSLAFQRLFKSWNVNWKSRFPLCTTIRVLHDKVSHHTCSNIEASQTRSCLIPKQSCSKGIHSFWRELCQVSILRKFPTSYVFLWTLKSPKFLDTALLPGAFKLSSGKAEITNGRGSSCCGRSASVFKNTSVVMKEHYFMAKQPQSTSYLSFLEISWKLCFRPDATQTWDR